MNKPASTLPELADTNRRGFLQSVSCIGALSLLGFPLMGCSKTEPIIRIATNSFPGYELLHLAEYQGYIKSDKAKILDMPSATAILQALAAGNIEGAALTLDEVISAKSDNMLLKIVAVLDVSLGADVALAKPGITDLPSLIGKRIGVEQSAVGAVMLASLLEKANLTINDIQVTYATVDEHAALYLDNKVDALVTFEPVTRTLLAAGAHKLFDSSEIPGMIVDVLVVREDVIKRSPNAIREVVSGQFHALKDLTTRPEEVSPIIAKRLGISPAEVSASYQGLELPDLKSNHEWLADEPPKLAHNLIKLQELMLNAKLIPNKVNIIDLIDAQFLSKE